MFRPLVKIPVLFTQGQPHLPEKILGFIATKHLGMSRRHIEDICYKDSLIISCLGKISPVLEPTTSEKCSDIPVKLPGVVAT